MSTLAGEIGQNILFIYAIEKMTQKIWPYEWENIFFSLFISA